MRLLLKYCLIGSLATTTGAGSIVLSAEPAYAERGGKGQGRGNGRNNSRNNDDRGNRAGNNNRGGNSASNNNRGGNSNLRGGNASNANQNALNNANSGAMVGKLAAYQQAELQRKAAESRVNSSYIELYRLQHLSDSQIAAEFPNGGYGAALLAAQSAYNSDAVSYTNLATTAEASLMAVTGGRALSDEALAQLNAQLGL